MLAIDQTLLTYSAFNSVMKEKSSGFDLSLLMNRHLGVERLSVGG